MKSILLAIFATAFVLLFVPAVNAYEIPQFPSCTAPSGVVKVSYPSGVHGIVGDPKTYSGADTVYSISPDTLTQCFCAEDGTGIQTNWWKVSSITQDEVETLKNLGWQFVANGGEWGLTNDPYMAINIGFSCKSGGNGGSSSSSSSSSSSGSSNSGQVLGLATTGNAFNLFGSLMAASVFLALGVTAKLHNREK